MEKLITDGIKPDGGGFIWSDIKNNTWGTKKMENQDKSPDLSNDTKLHNEIAKIAGVKPKVIEEIFNNNNNNNKSTFGKGGTVVGLCKESFVATLNQKTFFCQNMVLDNSCLVVVDKSVKKYMSEYTRCNQAIIFDIGLEEGSIVEIVN